MEFQYTLSLDAFSVGQYFFPADTITFSRVAGQQTVSLEGQSFAGFALQDATLTPYPFEQQFLTIRTVAGADYAGSFPGELFMLKTAGILTPTIDHPTVTGHLSNFAYVVVALNPRVEPEGYLNVYPQYYETAVHGTLTETGIGIPEPATVALMGIALALLLAQSKLRSGSHGH